MAKTYLVARREFMENARTKGFWISIFLGPILMLGAIGLMVFLQTKKDVRKFAVDDQTGWLAEAIEADFLAPDLEKIFKAFPDPSVASDAKDAEEGTETSQDGKLEAKEEAKEESREAAELPAFLRTETWRQFRQALTKASDEQKEQMKSLGSVLVSPALEQIGPDFPMDKIPGLAKGMLTRLDVGTGDIKKAWRDFWAFREWWQGLTKTDRDGLTRKGWDSRFELVRFEKDEKVGEKELQAKLKAGDLYAYFVLEDVPLDRSLVGRYHSNNVTDSALRRWYSNRATEVLRRKRVEKLGIGEQAAQQILMRATFTEKTVDASGNQKTVDISDKAEKGAPVVFVIILWMSILMISQMLLTNTIEEKSNRIIEVLLSSVSPLQLMSGKIMGLAWTGMAILGFYAVFAYTAITLAPIVLPGLADKLVALNLLSILANPRYLGSFFIYFIIGYLFYASLLVAVGSVSNSLKDAQNLAQPVMILLIIPYMASFTIISDPNGFLARVLSYIPPFTPFIMMARAGGPPPMMDYVLTTILLVISTAFCFYAAAKVFRVGVLMTGKPPKIREILRWLRAPVGQVPQTDHPHE